MRRLRYFVLALLLALPPLLQQRSYLDWYQDMVTAYRAGDGVAMAAAAEGALRLRPGFPAMMINLAIARVLAQQPEVALDLLERVAAMGLTYPLEGVADLAPLSETPRFRDVVARMQASAAAVGQAGVAFTLSPRDFFPEGVAAAGDGSFFVGSVRSGTVVRVDAAGTAQPFARLGWSVLGMKVDARRGLLWVSISGVAQTEDLAADRLGRAGIAALDLADGSLRAEYLLPDAGVERVVGDLVIDADGAVYASDSIAGGVWVLRPDADALQALLPDGSLASPQGLDIAANGALYVAAYNGGVYRVDGRSGAIQQVEAPDDVTLYGIDGLYSYGSDLIVVHNGNPPHRVVRLRLDADGNRVTAAQVLLRGDARFGEPTLGAIAGDDFYLVANSPWAHFADPDQPPDPAALPVPTVLRLSLAAPRPAR